MYNNLIRLVTQARVSSPRVLLAANNVLSNRAFPVYTREYATKKKDCKKDECPNKDLLNLPVPKLGDTLEKFLETCKPLLTPSELKATAKITQNYAINDGQACKMQCLLLEKAKNCENWLADWWIKTAYLDYRNSLVGWSSPGTPFAYKKFGDEYDWLKYSANVVLGALAFKKQIDENKLKQEMMGKLPLDMQQYHKILGTCRMPGEKSDCLQYNTDSRHIVVVCNNHFYKIEVYDKLCHPIGQDQLIEQLESIVKYSKKPAPAVGILTATDRNKWGKNFQALLSGAKCNEACIRYIQKALFLLCLDKPIADTDEEFNKFTISGMHTIHGGGSKYNSANRWFDKCIQFVVSRNGHNGITYEHSPAEGGPVVTMGDFIQDFIASCKGNDWKDACLEDPVPRTLVFKLSDKLNEAIECASNEVDAFIDNFDLHVFQYDEYGKEFIKSQKMSPDSYIQVAFQLAYYRLHEEPAPTYESAAMRHFIHGRTETIRSCTCAAVDFAKAMVDDCDDRKRAAKLRCAVAAHKAYVKAVLKGCGVDRHLLGLKLQALEKNVTPHEFFKSVGFVKSSTFKLSTSQVATKHKGFMGYGPSDEDGYGICYNPRPDDIIISVASFKCSKAANTENMVMALQAAFDDMHKVLCNAPQSNL